MRCWYPFLVACLTAGVVHAAEILRDEAGTAGLRFGVAASALEDQNDDGYWELLIGAPGYQAAGQDAGRVYLWFGGVALRLNADRTWVGQPGEQFGHAVARIGDVNGDGRPDFAVGAPYADNAGQDAGRVYIFYGGNQISATPDRILEGRRAGERFGWSITALGDFNGDGRDDFAVGAPYSDAGAVENGAVYVFYGRNGHPNATPDLTVTGTLAYERFGWAVAAADRFLGGSARCLAVGAPSTGSGAGSRQGAVYVFQGTTSPSPGPNTTANLVLYSSATETAQNAFGFSVAGVGNFGGDSAPDLAVGIPNYSGGALDRGRVEIFFGGTGADASADRYANGANAGDRLGWSVAGVGDVTGTVADDVVIGAPYDNTRAASAGRAFIWAGGSGNVTSAGALPTVDPGALQPGTAAGDLFGSWCAWAGDIDGDGLDDFVVGAPVGNLSNNATAGWVRLVDSSGTAVPVQFGAWRCAWTDDGAVAAAIDLHGSAEAVTWAIFERVDTATLAVATLHDGPPAAAGAVVRNAQRLLLHDRDAAQQLRGEPRYALTLHLDGGAVVAKQGLPGPTGPLPAAQVQLGPAQPNPFNPRTSLHFRAPAGVALTLRIYDLRGRVVRALHRGEAAGGWQQAEWDGRDEHGMDQASGVYLARLRAGQQERTVRVVLSR